MLANRNRIRVVMRSGVRDAAVRLTALFGVVTGSVSTAYAGNSDSFYLSGEAAMLGGAIVASSSSGGSIWYNPAGLASLSGTRLDANVSGYAIRFGATANFESTVPGAEEHRVSLLDLNIVPAALALTRRFGSVGIGIGVFVPSQSVVSLRTHLATPEGAPGTALEFGYDSKSTTQEYHVGPGIGWDPTDDLSVGSSLLVNYRTQFESTNMEATISTDDAVHAQSDHNTMDSIGVGLEAVLGAQWRLAPKWSLGLVVRTPAIRLGQMVDDIETRLLTNSDGEIVEKIDYNASLGLGTQLLTPFRFHAGLNYHFANIQASAEGSLLLPFKNEVADIQQRLTWNARAGLRGEVATRWAIGGGVYTDRSSSEAPEDFPGTQLNFYGVTVAVDWLSAYGVYAIDGVVLEEPHSLIFGTSLAFSYGIGVGQLASAEVGPVAGGQIEINPILSRVVAHEFSLHISSTIAE